MRVLNEENETTLTEKSKKNILRSKRDDSAFYSITECRRQKREHDLVLFPTNLGKLRTSKQKA